MDLDLSGRGSELNLVRALHVLWGPGGSREGLGPVCVRLETSEADSQFQFMTKVRDQVQNDLHPQTGTTEGSGPGSETGNRSSTTTVIPHTVCSPVNGSSAMLASC